MTMTPTLAMDAEPNTERRFFPVREPRESDHTREERLWEGKTAGQRGNRAVRELETTRPRYRLLLQLLLHYTYFGVSGGGETTSLHLVWWKGVLGGGLE